MQQIGIFQQIIFFTFYFQFPETLLLPLGKTEEQST